ncbi:hypothetical protein Tco_0927503 [Tanacetum coccineum]
MATIKFITNLPPLTNKFMQFVDSGLHFIGDVPLESLNKTADESLYDTESEIKIVKRFKPTIEDEEPLFTSVNKEHSDMEEDSDLASMPNDEVTSVSDLETSETKEDDNLYQPTKLSKSEERDADNVIDELTELKASADKQSLSDPLSPLRNELSHLTTKVQNIESSISKQVTDKLEETVPKLVVETLKETLPELISESLNKDLKKKLGVSIRKEVHKGMETVQGKLDYYTTMVDQNSVNVQDMTTLMKDMVAILDSASVFAKANAEGEK